MKRDLDEWIKLIAALPVPWRDIAEDIATDAMWGGLAPSEACEMAWHNVEEMRKDTKNART